MPRTDVIEALNVRPSVLTGVAQGASLCVVRGTLRFELPASVTAVTAEDLRRDAASICEAPGEGGACYPLSQGQLVQRYVRRLTQASPNVAVAFRIRSPLAVDRLGAAFSVCVQREPALRTVIFTTEDGPVRRVAGRPAASLGAVRRRRLERGHPLFGHASSRSRSAAPSFSPRPRSRSTICRTATT